MFCKRPYEHGTRLERAPAIRQVLYTGRTGAPDDCKATVGSVMDFRLFRYYTSVHLLKSTRQLISFYPIEVSLPLCLVDDLWTRASLWKSLLNSPENLFDASVSIDLRFEKSNCCLMYTLILRWQRQNARVCDDEGRLPGLHTAKRRLRIVGVHRSLPFEHAARRLDAAWAMSANIRATTGRKVRAKQMGKLSRELV